MRRRWLPDDDAGEEVRVGTLTTPRESAEGCCRICAYAFRFNAAFYRERGLAPPRTCARCRAVRRSAALPLRLAGVVDALRDDHVFILNEGGTRFFAHRRNAVTWPLTLGARVSFEPAADPRDYARPRRCPRAFVVRIEEAGGYAHA